MGGEFLLHDALLGRYWNAYCPRQRIQILDKEQNPCITFNEAVF